MVQQTSIQPSAPWLRLDVDDSDWNAAEVSSLVRWYHQMLLIRRFEEKILDLANAGLVHGPAHASIGQEATRGRRHVGARHAATASTAPIAPITRCWRSWSTPPTPGGYRRPCPRTSLPDMAAIGATA